MKKYKLIKLSNNNFIIINQVSTNTIGTYVYNDEFDGEPLIYKADKEFFRIGKDAHTIIAGYDDLPQIDFSGLSRDEMDLIGKNEWFVEIDMMLQVRHGVDWYNLPNQSEGREVDGIYRHIPKIENNSVKVLKILQP